MKIVDKRIEIIAHHEPDGKTIPVRFRISLEGELQTYNVKVKTFDMTKVDGEKAILYRCDIHSDGQILSCELLFIINKTVWKLHRI